MTTININLLGIEQKDRLRLGGSLPVDRGWLLAVVVMLCGVAAALGGTVVLNGLLANTEAHLAELQDEIKSLEGQLGEIKNLEAKKKQAVAEQRVLEYVTGRTYHWSSFLNELRDLTPENLWIEAVSVSGDQLSLSGNTFDHQTVAYFLASLQASPFFKDAALGQSDKSVDKGQVRVHFTMKATLDYDVTPPSDAAAKPDAQMTSGQVPQGAAADAARGKSALKGNRARVDQAVGG